MAYLNSIKLKDESGSKKTLELIEELEDFDEILVGEGFFQWENSARIVVTDEIFQNQVVPLKCQLTPVKELRDEFYEFIVTRWKIFISEDYNDFLREWDKAVFGKDALELRKYASGLFLDIMSELKPEGFDKVVQTVNSEGDVVSYTQAKFEYLYYHRNALKRALATKDMVVPFLCGDLEYFTEELILQNLNIRTVVNFETHLKILLNLNRQFKFEEDNYFSKAAELKRIYEESYRDLFENFDLFLFVYNKIASFWEYPKVLVQCFFLALAGKGILEENKPKNYLKFLENEFGYKLTRIKRPEKHKNWKYYERVQLLTTEIEKYEASFR